ncbi:hypothetical protein L7F22_022979 [Adiantum nelumboides]|nr:hypothetical protein [Adiantum nelumboides]
MKGQQANAFSALHIQPMNAHEVLIAVLMVSALYYLVKDWRQGKRDVMDMNAELITRKKKGVMLVFWWMWFLMHKTCHDGTLKGDPTHFELEKLQQQSPKLNLSKVLYLPVVLLPEKRPFLQFSAPCNMGSKAWAADLAKMVDKLIGNVKENKKIVDTSMNAILIRLSKMERDMETWQKEKEEWEKDRIKWEEEKIAMQAQMETMKG